MKSNEKLDKQFSELSKKVYKKWGIKKTIKIKQQPFKVSKLDRLSFLFYLELTKTSSNKSKLETGE